jgi:hypothetical protein
MLNATKKEERKSSQLLRDLLSDLKPYVGSDLYNDAVFAG